jgi:hypothetical protein
MGGRQEIRARRKDRTEFPAEASLSKAGSNEITMASAIVRDATERM